ncbi:MAG: SDR family NAD(P)-dependent oxidoreductase [Chromatiales bacterium]
MAPNDFQIVALTPPGLCDASVAIAASRAGGVGVLDLQYVSDMSNADSAIKQLSQFARQSYGVKLGTNPEIFDLVVAAAKPPTNFGIAILTLLDTERLPDRIEILRRHNLKVILEVISLDEASLGEELGVDLLIAKGHEGGGRVGEETTYVLLQRLSKYTSLPVWVQGGIGLHTVAACYAAGAVGVVLDFQLALCRESALPEFAKTAISRMDGSETLCVSSPFGEQYRMYHRHGLPPIEALRQFSNDTSDTTRSFSSTAHKEAWRQLLHANVGWKDSTQNVWLLGQDAALAAPLGRRFSTVGGTLDAMRQAVETHVRIAKTMNPLVEGAPLALSHGTRFPIVQGPMTRVSDTADFACEVANAGALPFLALALMRKQEVETLLGNASQLLSDRPWGVGILGFVPSDLRTEQIDVIRKFRPSFALIAGGRPDQALVLEREGIATYLHVPSPGLLKLFVELGARRFVFEGRECGGHVGPRTSFALWDTMIDTLLESLTPAEISECHILFAGGIHDSMSSCMVATIAAPLAERGAKIGVLVGTAYLFTKEAVSAGAILGGFQQEAIQCTNTVLLESGTGHATRCADTAYVKTFFKERQNLLSKGCKSSEEIRNALEDLNLGRLRIAAKGVTRNPRYELDAKSQKLVPVPEEEQHTQGMYMIGQVAALRNSVCTLAELHEALSVGSSQRLSDLAEPVLSRVSLSPKEHQCDVAIIGMGCLLPKAPNLQTYWENILNKVDAITEVPPNRWDWRKYFDPDQNARDKIYSKWGGFLDDISFDPISYGIPPNSLRSIEPLQLLTLEVVRAALGSAGYAERPFPRHRTSVILGAGGGIADLGNHYAVRSALPALMGSVPEDLLSKLPEWTEDSFAGILLNVAAGRVANRFDLGGVSYTVDAACASSLAAVHLAVRELEAGASDMVIVGGVDTVQNPFGYLCFSKTHALSPSGRCRTFDASADGIAISEGLAVLVLKRLTDAETDGDRIYAVIKAAAGSSDGRDKGLTAPRPEGQALALERAYAKAGFSPATVGFIEAHGTGTVAGDQAEVETLRRVFGKADAAAQSCAIGSVKSMIGHTKCAAGIAGLIKAALALYHKVLPPTINVQKPNPKACFSDSPFYVNTELRPWISRNSEHPRRAGISAFGFGGTNFHAVLEEYTGDFLESKGSLSISETWPSELMLWTGNSRQEILAAIKSLNRELAKSSRPEVKDLSYTLWMASERPSLTLAIVVTSLDDLKEKLSWAEKELKTTGRTGIEDPRGIYYSEEPMASSGKIAFLFPGQGSQYPNMLRDLAIHFREVRERFEVADHVLRGSFAQPLSSFVFPPPCFSDDEREARERALMQTEVAQPALGASELAMIQLLRILGVQPDMAAGHSYGEYVALCCAGVFAEEALYRLSLARGRCIQKTADSDPGTMAAVTAAPECVRGIIETIQGVWIANVNSREQAVISGTRQAVGQAIERFQMHGIQWRPLQVACAFHSPMMQPARDHLSDVLNSFEFQIPKLKVFTNAGAVPYPEEAKAVTAILANHLVSPVRFMDEIEAMYETGARIFIEVGPRKVLTNLAKEILKYQPHVCVATDGDSRSGILQLHHALGRLAAEGVPVDLSRFYSGRKVRYLALGALEKALVSQLPRTSWLVNGGRAKPLYSNSPTGKETTDKEGRQPETKTQKSQPAVDTTSMEGTQQPYDQPDRALDKAICLKGEKGAGVVEKVPPTKENAQEIMAQFQNLMHRFLDTQRNVMSAYLRYSSDVDRQEYDSIGQAPLTAKPTGAFEDLPHRTAVQSASQPEQVEFSYTSEKTSDALERSVVQAVSSSDKSTLDRDEIQRLLISLVSEKTGYPEEMVDIGADLEADLGVDSLKKVEIFGELGRRVGEIGSAMEQINRLRSLREVLDFVAARIGDKQQAENLVEGDIVLAAGLRKVQQGKDVLVAASRSLRGSTTGSGGVNEGGKSSKLIISSTEDAAQEFLKIVSERTGYPREMLDLSLDVELDLGIEPIKKVEILSALLRSLSMSYKIETKKAMGTLTGIKTLGGIKDAVSHLIRQSHPEKMGGQPMLDGGSLTSNRSDDGKSDLTRCIVKAVETPLSGRAVSIVTDRVVVITDDEQGIARLLGDTLVAQGHSVALVRMSNGTARMESGLYLANLLNPRTTAEILEVIRREQGPIGHIIHLLPLKLGSDPRELEISTWLNRVPFETKSLFYLVKAASIDFRKTPRHERNCIVAATSMGGAFAVGPTRTATFFPSQGGLAGFIKSLNKEWPHVRHKSIDFDASLSPSGIAHHLLEEMIAEDEEVEVGYSGSRRVVLRTLFAPLNRNSASDFSIGPDCNILVTGGARGITARVAYELAVRYRPNLLVVGRSPLPESEESPETTALNSIKDIKDYLIKRMRASGQWLTTAQIETACYILLRDREIRSNLEAMRRVGASVRYYQVDVRDQSAFKDLIERIYVSYGHIDGVIHGAGIIEDKLVEDKTPDSFDRVIDTKITGAYVLSRCLRPESLKFLAFFGSVAGRFGNRGQADYAAANEILNKLAQYLDHSWSSRVVVFNWGPWDETGMVSEAVARQFQQAGVELISPKAGCSMFDAELRYGRKGEVEIVLGRGPWSSVHKPMSKREDDVPMISALRIDAQGAAEFVYELDASRDLYLQDHRIDGNPVLPLTMAAELMAEFVLKLMPDRQIIGIDSLKLLKGIVLKDGSKSIRIVANKRHQPEDQVGNIQVDVEIEEQRSGRASYTGTIVTSNHFPPPPTGNVMPEHDISDSMIHAADAYERYLFHGPLFHCITDIRGIWSEGYVATVRSSNPSACLSGSLGNSWVLDPILLDSAPQLALIWAREKLGVSALPSGLRQLRRYKKRKNIAEYNCYFQVDLASDDHSIITNVYFTDEDSQLAFSIEGLECICSLSLNRIARGQR